VHTVLGERSDPMQSAENALTLEVNQISDEPIRLKHEGHVEVSERLLCLVTHVQGERLRGASAAELSGHAVDAHPATAIAGGECRRRHCEDCGRYGDE